MVVNHFKPAINLETAIIKTLAFFDIRNQPLTVEEIQDYLLNRQSDLSEVYSTAQTIPIIASQSPYFYFKNKAEIVDLRAEREEIATQYWRKIHLILPILSLIPYIKLMAICNNLPVKTVDKNSDIDLFIITKKNRLFTTRFLLTLCLQLLGQRRHGRKVAGRFCLSFYVTENYLNLEKLQIKPYDIYLAYWVKTLQPVLDCGSYQQFIQANQGWLKNYFPIPIKPQLSHLKKSHAYLTAIKNLQEYLLNTVLGDMIEDRMRRWQKRRALQKKARLGPAASIIITNDILKFHNIDKRREIYEQWQEKVDEVLGL